MNISEGREMTGLALMEEVTFVVCVQLVHKVRVSDYFVQTFACISRGILTVLRCPFADSLSSNRASSPVCQLRSSLLRIDAFQ